MAREFPDAGFPILTGVSAGAINATHRAASTVDFVEATDRLVQLWRSLTVQQVFRTDPLNLGSHMLRWAVRLVSGGGTLSPATHGMVNSEPLRDFLRLSFGSGDGALPGIAENLRSGRLEAVGITTTDYTAGRAVTWVQGRHPSAWERPGRRSQQAELTIEHVLASASLPIFFPAIRIGPHWHGDGGVQLVAPLAPALYLGADSILAISNRHVPATADENTLGEAGYPSPARIIGLLLRAVFLDMLDYDARVLERINELASGLPEAGRRGVRPVKFFLVRPSQDLSVIANEFETELPRGLRFALRGLGTHESRRAELLATLLFQPGYIQRLIEIGEADARAARPRLANFLKDRTSRPATPSAVVGR
jgi:NTE family protein